MTQQSLTRSIIRRVKLRCQSGPPTRLGLASWMPVVALLVSAAAPPRVIAQYSQPPQNGYASRPTVGGNSDAALFAGQADEQLAAEARLFQQQGRTAQAQRVYIELQRRSLVRAQSRLAPPMNRMTATMAPGGVEAQAQMAAPVFAYPSSQFQASPQFQNGQPPSQAASNWASPNVNNQVVDRENFSLQAVQNESVAAARPPIETASGALQPAAAILAAGESGERAPVMVLDRQLTPPTPQVARQAGEQKSGGWRPAVTPLPPALVQGAPPQGPAPANEAKPSDSQPTANNQS